MLLSKMYQKVNRITNNFELFVRDAVNNTHLELEQMQREQMLSGKDAGGSEIGKYSNLSKTLRAEKGLQTSFVDLRDTGDFQKAITVQANENEIDYYSKDWKQTELIYKYGERIFGLFNTSKKIQIIKTELLKLIKNELQ